jgi:hypothetical protein
VLVLALFLALYNVGHMAYIIWPRG